MAKSSETCLETCHMSRNTKTVEAAMIRPSSLHEVSQAFGLMSDLTRLKILIAIDDARELCVCDVATALGITTALASHHLRKLREAGILKHRKEGKLVLYSVDDALVARELVNCLGTMIQAVTLSSRPVRSRRCTESQL